MKRTIRQVESKIKSLFDWYSLASSERVMKLIDQIRKENRPEIELLEKELAELKANKPKPKPRWPENTPTDVLEFCQKYWSGSEESRTFRIHCWNDKAVWTSYPSGGYSDNGGFHPTPARFILLSRTEMGHRRAKELKELEGRVKLSQMEEELTKL